jgi:hypothetical protein
MARRISVALLVVGAALIWPVPIGGALVMLTGALGLAVAMEDELISEGLIAAEARAPRHPTVDDLS